MTSKTSLAKFNPSINMFKFTTKKSVGLTILVSAFLLLICPGYVFMHVNSIITNNPSTIYQFNTTIISVSIGLTVLTSLIAIIFCFINFSYIFSKRAGDVYHSLPLTRNQLFNSRFFSSTIFLIIPIALCYLSLALISSFPGVKGSLAVIATGFVLNVLIMFMCAAFSMIFMICSGTAFDYIISFLGINIGLLIIAFTFMDICEYFLKGFVSTNSYSSLKYSSPIYYGFYTFYSLFNMFGVVSLKHYLIKLVIVCLKITAIFAVCFIASIVLYNNRKSEMSEQPYAYKILYVIFTVIVSIVGAYGLGVVFGNGVIKATFWVFASIGSVLAAITVGAITARGFGTFKKSLIIGICGIMVLAITTFTIKADVFGYSKVIPDKVKVASVSLTFNSFEIDTENSDKIIEFHKKIINKDDSVVKPDYGDEQTTYVKFNYFLKSGRHLNREFCVKQESFLSDMLELYRSDENSKSITDYANKFSNSVIVISDEKAKGEYDEQGSAISEIAITKKELKDILYAYSNDIKNATNNSLLNEDTHEYYINGHSDNNEYVGLNLILEDQYVSTKNVINEIFEKANK